MGRLEAGAVSINPQNRHETTYRPDGSVVTTTVEPENPAPQIRLGRGHLSEADHVIVAIDQGVPVNRAEASDEAGVTFLARADATVAAAHWDRGGDGWDNMIIHSLRANKGAARRRASMIKANRAHERDAIARLLAAKGSASGSEMENAAANARDERVRGRRVRVLVSVTDSEGTTTSLQTHAREKDRNVRLPREWETRPPQRRRTPDVRRRRAAVAA